MSTVNVCIVLKSRHPALWESSEALVFTGHAPYIRALISRSPNWGRPSLAVISGSKKAQLHANGDFYKWMTKDLNTHLQVLIKVIRRHLLNELISFKIYFPLRIKNFLSDLR